MDYVEKVKQLKLDYDNGKLTQDEFLDQFMVIMSKSLGECLGKTLSKLKDNSKIDDKQ